MGWYLQPPPHPTPPYPPTGLLDTALQPEAVHFDAEISDLWWSQARTLFPADDPRAVGGPLGPYDLDLEYYYDDAMWVGREGGEKARREVGKCAAGVRAQEACVRLTCRRGWEDGSGCSILDLPQRPAVLPLPKCPSIVAR